MGVRITQLASATVAAADQMEVSKRSASVTKTATTISAAAADNSYNDSGGGFVSAGFAQGDNVVVSGFSTGANNINSGIITAVTANKMTIGGTDGDVIVDESAGNSVTITKWESKRTTANAVGNVRTDALLLTVGDETTAITTGTAKLTFRMPFAFTLTALPRASLSTAQTSGTIFTVDINEGGASILSTKLTIDNTEKTSTTAATPAVLSDTSLADDAEITVDVDQIGDSTAAGLKITLIGVPTIS